MHGMRHLWADREMNAIGRRAAYAMLHDCSLTSFTADIGRSLYERTS